MTRLAILAVGCSIVVLIAGSKSDPSSGPPTASEASTASRPEVVTNSIGMKFVLVPAGSFVMGLPDEVRNHDPPLSYAPHTVQISRPFLLGMVEVTQHQFRRVVPSSASGGAVKVAAEMPVTNITWKDAERFCSALSALPSERAAGRTYRLPTEAEWEYACRGGRKIPFEGRAGGADRAADQSAIRPIGMRKPNEFGLYDMRENAWEWCADWYQTGYYRNAPSHDPQGPESGVARVVRGRQWVFSEFEHCLLTRDPMSPWRSSPLVGFRVVCTVAANP